MLTHTFDLCTKLIFFQIICGNIYGTSHRTCCKSMASVQTHPDTCLVTHPVYYASQFTELPTYSAPLTTHVFKHC